MTRLTDEQRLAVESIDKHVLVSAGAGSGKTSVLVSRYLRVLECNPDASVTNLIAVTFTRKAADEMRSRLKSELKKRAAATTGAEKERWLELLSRIDQARIGTIHSLCESILRAFPAEALMDPQFDVLDDLERAQLLDEIIDGELRGALIREEEHIRKLLEFSASEVSKWLRELVSRPSAYKAARAVSGEPALFERLWMQAASAAFKTVSSSAKLQAAQKQLDTLTSSGKFEANRVQALLLCESLFSPLRPERLHADLQQRLLIADGFAEISFKGTRNAGEIERQIMSAVNCIKDALKKLRKEIPSEKNEADQSAEFCQRALIELADRAIEQFEHLKNQHQKVDFDDLIDRTHALLSQPGSHARRHYHGTLKAILVDEFQDTNKRQAELLSFLVGGDARLFLIGDDKQSIYRFQGADVSTFTEWKERLGSDSESGLLLSLTRSFRSHPGIVLFVNAMFEKLFSVDDRFEARHQALVAARPEPLGDQNIEIVLLSSDEGVDEKLSSQAFNELESQAIAAWIHEKVAAHALVLDKELGQQRPIQFCDFAVLVQNNSDFAPIEMALADAGIPYVTMSGAGYLNRQEIFDLENLLKFLSAPEDSHALLGVLRSPMFGVPDDVIHSLHQTNRSLWSRLRKAGLQEECSYTGVQRAVSVLRELLRGAAQMPLVELVRYALQLTQYDLILSALPNGKQRSRNVWKFLSLAAQHAERSVRGFLEMLDSMRNLSVKAGDAPLAADNAVQLMTIHKSKGLEFGAVALPSLSKRFHKGDRKIIFSEEYGIAVDARGLDDEQRPASFTLAGTIERQMEAAEKKRLLYVAMTRARDYLGLFMQAQVSPQHPSFRTLIKDTLELDDEPATTAHYSLVQLTPLVVRSNLENFKAAASVTISQRSNSADPVSFSFIEPLAEQPDCAEFNVPFEHLLRVTPDKRPLHATVIGSFFHAVMESLPKDLSLPDRERLSELAGNSTLSGVVHRARRQELVIEAEQMLRVFCDSQLYRLMAGARERLHEVPYFALREPDAEAPGLLQPARVEEKRPDLLLQDSYGEWHIVDFKTDHIDEMEIEKHNRAHADQINEYVRDFETLVNAPVKGWVYYAHHGLLVQLDKPAAPIQLKIIVSPAAPAPHLK